MENPQKILEKLKQENQELKKLIVETEFEMDNIKTKAYEEMIKTKNLINSLVPALMKTLGGTSENKFTQYDEAKDFNYHILLLEGLDSMLETAHIELQDLQEKNSNAASKIKEKILIYEKLTKRREESLTNIQNLINEKNHLISEINTLQTNAVLYEESTSESLTLSVYTALDLARHS